MLPVSYPEWASKRLEANARSEWNIASSVNACGTKTSARGFVAFFAATSRGQKQGLNSKTPIAALKSASICIVFNCVYYKKHSQYLVDPHLQCRISISTVPLFCPVETDKLEKGS